MRVAMHDAIKERLIHLHDTKGLSWREISQTLEFKEVPYGTLNDIYHDKPIPKKWVLQLQLAHLRRKVALTKANGSFEDLQAQYGDVNPYYYSRLIREDGYRPPDWVLMAWGIEMPQVEVLVVDGVIPNRTLVIAGSIKRCRCGQWYLSNAPARKKCPLCSPYKGGKK